MIAKSSAFARNKPFEITQFVRAGGTEVVNTGPPRATEVCSETSVFFCLPSPVSSICSTSQTLRSSHRTRIRLPGHRPPPSDAWPGQSWRIPPAAASPICAVAHCLLRGIVPTSSPHHRNHRIHACSTTRRSMYARCNMSLHAHQKRTYSVFYIL